MRRKQTVWSLCPDRDNLNLGQAGTRLGSWRGISEVGERAGREKASPSQLAEMDPGVGSETCDSRWLA